LHVSDIASEFGDVDILEVSAPSAARHLLDFEVDHIVNDGALTMGAGN
jgi:hypothetical protein